EDRGAGETALGARACEVAIIHARFTAADRGSPPPRGGRVLRNRLVLLLALFLIATGLPVRSSNAQPLEKIVNWTAPPYWMPTRAAAVRAPAIERSAIPSSDIAGPTGVR